MAVKTGLQLYLFDNDLSSPTLVETLTSRVEGLRFGSALHGGFKACHFRVAMDLGEAWQYTERDGLRGRHFYRLEVREGTRLVWEGRLAELELRVDPDFVGIHFTFYGYWNALRDQLYTADDHTDWTVTSGGADDIIKEMLTQECPDINSDQSNIDANTRDLQGIDLSGPGRYPQDIIVEDLAPLADSDNSVWHFAVWDDRKPYWKKRTVPTYPDWRCYLKALGQGSNLRQSASLLRNAVKPVVSGSGGTVQTNSESLGKYPQRELPLQLPDGTNTNTQADAAQTAANERGLPRQSEQFVITGELYASSVGDLVEVPKWRVRAGDVIRIEDLVPASSGVAELDSLRTFHILEALYDADTDTLTIHPDTASRSLSGLLPRLGSVERRS